MVSQPKWIETTGMRRKGMPNLTVEEQPVVIVNFRQRHGAVVSIHHFHVHDTLYSNRPLGEVDGERILVGKNNPPSPLCEKIGRDGDRRSV